MQFAEITGSYRNGTGKSVNRKLRQKGQIPAVLYGKGQEPISIAIDPTTLKKTLDPERRANTVLKLKLDGTAPTTGAAPADLTVMLRDWQSDPLRGDLVHADFVRVHMDKDVHATVPLVIVGKAPGLAKGGTLHQVFRALEVACTPDKIPSKIEVSVDALDLGEALHVRDLKMGEGVRPLVDGSLTVCTITIPRAEKAAAEGAAEGAAEAAAAPAAGAKAEGGKGDAKPAAGAAKGGDAKAPAKK